MKRNFFFIALFLFLFSFLQSAKGVTAEELGPLISPNMPVEQIPKDLMLPDVVLPYLKAEFNNSIGKDAAFDTQFKIVLLTTKITNNSAKKYDFLEEVVKWDVRTAKQTENKIIIVSPDARVLAIKALSESSNSAYIPVMLMIIERDDVLKPRMAAAKALPALGDPNLILPKMVDLLKNQYGASRAKFSEGDQKRFDDDKVAQAIIESLGDIGDPRAFSVLLRTVMSPETHRDETIKAGWEAMKKLKW